MLLALHSAPRCSFVKSPTHVSINDDTTDLRGNKSNKLSGCFKDSVVRKRRVNIIWQNKIKVESSSNERSMLLESRWREICLIEFQIVTIEHKVGLGLC